MQERRSDSEHRERLRALCGTTHAHLVNGCDALDLMYTSVTPSSTISNTDGVDALCPSIGFDPSFSPKSRLYDLQVADTPGDWYNASSRGQLGGEVNEFGMPRGFTHEAMEGECTSLHLHASRPHPPTHSTSHPTTQPTTLRQAGSMAVLRATLRYLDSALCMDICIKA